MNAYFGTSQTHSIKELNFYLKCNQDNNLRNENSHFLSVTAHKKCNVYVKILYLANETKLKIPKINVIRYTSKKK